MENRAARRLFSQFALELRYHTVRLQSSCGSTTSVTGRRRRSHPQDAKLHPASFDFGDWATPRKGWQDFFARRIAVSSSIADVKFGSLDAAATGGVAFEQSLEKARGEQRARQR